MLVLILVVVVVVVIFFVVVAACFCFFSKQNECTKISSVGAGAIYPDLIFARVYMRVAG